MPAKVTVHQQDGKFELRVNGEPFYIKGAGLEFGNITALAKHKGNKSLTAQSLGISRKTLYEKIERYGIEL